jgi:hypothetical protein
MVQRVDCPLCRFQLAELPDYSDDDDSEDEDLEDEDLEDDSEDEDLEDDDDLSDDNTSNDNTSNESTLVPIDHSVTCKQAAQKLISIGYKPEDLIYMLVGRLDRSERTKYNQEFREKFENDLDRILTRELPVDYRDTRTYAQVVGITHNE